LSALIEHQTKYNQPLVLFLDQMEELFTRGFSFEECERFIQMLYDSTRDGCLWVIATVRSEFLHRLEEIPITLQLLNEGHTYHLGPVSPRVLQDMVEKPAQATGYDFDPGLVDRILRDAGQEPGNLPLVAYALNELFKRRDERRFTLQSYKAINGVGGAISNQAEQVMNNLKREASEAYVAFERVFSVLVNVEPDGTTTRRRGYLSEFAEDRGAQKLIEALAGADCRVLISDLKRDTPFVEVAHEKLFTAWPRLRDWIAQGADALRLISHASAEAHNWQRRGDRPDELWNKERIGEVNEALQRFGKTPDKVLVRFLHPQTVLEKQLHNAELSHQQRALIGIKLAELGDRRRGVSLTTVGLPDIDWIEIPGGKVKLKEGKWRAQRVRPFKIARYPVTNIQFQAFVDAEDGYGNEKWWADLERRTDSPEPPYWSEANHPRENVTWYEAVAFCRWLSARLGYDVHLPTEWAWQQAATGGDPNNVYPWGPDWEAPRCNSDESGLNRTTAVGMYPSGSTPQGVLDMAGNVWEWCLNKYDDPKDIRIDRSGGRRVLRGGSWFYRPQSLRSAARSWSYPDDRELHRWFSSCPGLLTFSLFSFTLYHLGQG
jgi:hypothetical protein